MYLPQQRGTGVPYFSLLHEGSCISKGRIYDDSKQDVYVFSKELAKRGLNVDLWSGEKTMKVDLNLVVLPN